MFLSRRRFSVDTKAFGPIMTKKNLLPGKGVTYEYLNIGSAMYELSLATMTKTPIPTASKMHKTVMSFFIFNNEGIERRASAGAHIISGVPTKLVCALRCMQLCRSLIPRNVICYQACSEKINTEVIHTLWQVVVAQASLGFASSFQV